MLGPLGPTPGQQTTAGTTTQAMQDQMNLLFSVRTDEALTQLEAITGKMKAMGTETEGTSSTMKNMMGLLSRGAAWFGIGIGLDAVIGKLLDTQQAFMDMEKSMYSVGLEATRGGGLLMSWADTANEVAISAIKNLYTEMFTAYRLTDKEINTLLTAVAQSGVGATKVVGATADEVTSSINEVIQATRDAFILQSLGFSPDQIRSLYHDMAVNLSLDTKEMRQEFLGFLTVASQIPLSLHEQIGVVTDLMSQYSKFGVTMGEVVRNMDAIVTENTKISASYTNVGLSIDQMKARMGLLTAGSPEERASLMAILSPAQRQRVLFGETTGAAREALTERYRGLWQSSGLAAAGASFEEFIQGRGDMRAYGLAPMWGAYPTEGRSLAVAQGMQNVQQQMGGGPEAIYNLELMMTKMFPGLMAEFQSIKFRGGKPAEELIASNLESFGKTMEDKVAEVKEQMIKQGKDPTVLPTDADAYFKTAGDKLSDIVKETTGARKDAQYVWQQLLRGEYNPEYRKEMMDTMSRSPKEIMARLEARMMEAPGKTEQLRESQIAVVEALATRLYMEGIDVSGIVEAYKTKLRSIEGDLTERSKLGIVNPEETARDRFMQAADQYRKVGRALDLPYAIPQLETYPEYLMTPDEFQAFMTKLLTENPTAAGMFQHKVGAPAGASISETWTAMMKGIYGQLQEQQKAGVPIMETFGPLIEELESIPKDKRPSWLDIEALKRQRGAAGPGGSPRGVGIESPGADLQSYAPEGRSMFEGAQLTLVVEGERFPAYLTRKAQETINVDKVFNAPRSG